MYMAQELVLLRPTANGPQAECRGLQGIVARPWKANKLGVVYESQKGQGAACQSRLRHRKLFKK